MDGQSCKHNPVTLSSTSLCKLKYHLSHCQTKCYLSLDVSIIHSSITAAKLLPVATPTCSRLWTQQ